MKKMLVLASCDFDHCAWKNPSKKSGEHGGKEKEREDCRSPSAMGLPISDEFLEHVRGAKSTKEMWDAIKNIFSSTLY